MEPSDNVQGADKDLLVSRVVSKGRPSVLQRRAAHTAQDTILDVNFNFPFCGLIVFRTVPKKRTMTAQPASRHIRGPR